MRGMGRQVMLFETVEDLGAGPVRQRVQLKARPVMFENVHILAERV